jgi:hypothetical protein
VNAAEERALLEMFSVVDSVFTEIDAFDVEKISIAYGRIFRSWKRTRAVLAVQSYAPLKSRIPEPKASGSDTPTRRDNNSQG